MINKIIEGDLLPGDIVGIYSESLFALLEYKLISPPTSLFHFLVIARKCEYEDDYEIYESISKGTATGRLSMYDRNQYMVFRFSDPDIIERGDLAVELASKFGRRKYDYMLYLKLLTGAIRCWIEQIWTERRLRRIWYDELPFARNDAFVCTELANEIWRAVDAPIVSEGHISIPAGIWAQYLQGKLDLVGVHKP